MRARGMHPWMLRLLLFSICSGTLAAGADSAERATDETVQEMFRTSHGVMKEQRQRVLQLTDAFLTGNQDLIQQKANGISRAMKEVVRQFPPDEGQEAGTWKAMAEVVENAQLLQQAVVKEKYGQAYRYFSSMVGRCIACHQVRRVGGLFPEFEEEEEKKASQ